MNCEQRTVNNVRRIAWSLCAGMMLCAAAQASARTIFKQVDVAGHVTYTDRPDTIPLPESAAIPVPDVATALAGNYAMSSRHAVMVDAKEAARRLGQAERERVRGAERLPGEQAGSGDAGTINDRYRRRQDELQRAVGRAHLRSIKAVRLLRETR